MTLLGYAADAAVIATYAVLALTGRSRAFHWANALGCFPVAYTEIAAGAHVALILTAFFGLVGWVGVFSRKALTA